jgi:hypothetical protein
LLKGPAKADWSFNRWLTKPKFSQAHRQLPQKAKRPVGVVLAVVVAAALAAETIVVAVMATVVVVMTSADKALKMVAKS